MINDSLIYVDFPDEFIMKMQICRDTPIKFNQRTPFSEIQEMIFNIFWKKVEKSSFVQVKKHGNPSQVMLRDYKGMKMESISDLLDRIAENQNYKVTFAVNHSFVPSFPGAFTIYG